MVHARYTALSAEVVRELRALHFHTRKLVDRGITGQYRSAFKGRGIEFEELREYQPGDDIRTIDWKVTARSRTPFIKRYREEREIDVVIAVDVSHSTLTGTGSQTREDLVAKAGAALTLIALNNNDKVGLVTFSNKVETYFPPRKARSAVWRILHEVLMPERKHSPSTKLETVFSFLSGVLKKTSVIFIISDFIDSGYERALAILSKRHDVTAVVISDKSDIKFPKVGLVQISDPETGHNRLVDSSSSEFLSFYKEQAKTHKIELRDILRRHRVGCFELVTGEPYIPIMREYFDRKVAHRLRTLEV